MTKYFRLSLVFILFGLYCTTFASPTIAQEEKEDDELTKERKEKEKDQKKRDEKFNEEKVYKFMVGRDVLPLPMFYISLYVKGRLVEGKLRVAIQTSSPAARRSLNVEKMALKGIIYPLAIRMWENGRPTTEDIQNFKADATKRLKTRYDDLVKEVFIESIL
ncbi:MAG: hypothetical protein P8P46_02490 [Alphaproteobacteria bacterium]|nr:hypothetical protein [Alphaproteobacteria bacterium]